jgi:transcriptional regulator with XRE-family HTH domain
MVLMGAGNDMEDFKNRLLEFIERQLGISQREFERKCGLTQGTVPSIKVKGPSVEVLIKISNAYPELNMNWLIAGAGDMFITAPVQTIQGDNNHHNTNGSDGKYIVHLEEEVAALRKEKEELWQMVHKLMA